MDVTGIGIGISSRPSHPLVWALTIMEVKVSIREKLKRLQS
jgi:hypothetical protein